MGLTEEQQKVVDHQGNARVNAVAGSGKTHTLVEYTRARPGKSILYLAYNRSVKEEAIDKFLRAGCANVRVETAHSLAYRGLDVRRRFTLHPGGNLKVYDVLAHCDIKPSRPGSVYHLILARHIQRYLNLYLNSDALKLAEVDYLGGIDDPGSLAFAEEHADKIYELTWMLLKKMYQAKIPVTHDAYLKFWALTNPVMSYDTILFDEGQDASPVMLQTFLNQDATRIIVGDTHQQIYRWRGAVNSLEKVKFPTFSLSTSFRFRQPVADLAMDILQLKNMFGKYDKKVSIVGAGDCRDVGSYAVLSRGNLNLLDRAIEFILENRKARLHFEGELSSYTFSEGASLFDILYLRMCQYDKIRGDFIKGFQNFDALREYAGQANDQEISLMIEIVCKYNRELFTYMNMLHECQVEKSRADVIFSTTHKAKGQEYDVVEVCPGYITADKIAAAIAAATKAAAEKDDAKPLDVDGLAEEVNCLYVASTRVRNRLIMGFDILDSKAECQRSGLRGFDPGEEQLAVANV